MIYFETLYIHKKSDLYIILIDRWYTYIICRHMINNEPFIPVKISFTVMYYFINIKY